MVHNIDTLARPSMPEVLGLVIESGATLSFEVIPRRIDDRGGGLAKVAGRSACSKDWHSPAKTPSSSCVITTRSRPGSASMDCSQAFGLDPRDSEARSATRRRRRPRMAARVPTYVTIKDVKRRWGHGQEDVYPIAQFEKLWGDLSSLPDLNCSYLAVSRQRGQQLKDTAQLDGWVNDGSMSHVQSLCDFSRSGVKFLSWPLCLPSGHFAARQIPLTGTWWNLKRECGL